jgi:hypothetical protein
MLVLYKSTYWIILKPYFTIKKYVFNEGGLLKWIVVKCLSDGIMMNSDLLGFNFQNSVTGISIFAVLFKI